MGSMTNIFEEISLLFSAAQETAACHQKNSILLRKIYQRSDFKKFCEVFLGIVDLALLIDYKQANPCVDKLFDYLGVFCGTLKRQVINNTEEEEDSFIEDPLILKLFEHLLEASKCILDTLRFRSCQLINKILDHLVGNDISSELCDQLQIVLIGLLSDSKYVIRLQAIDAIYRLQDPSDPEDEIIYELINLMYDTHAKVRQLCTEKIAVRLDVVGHVLKRTRDIDPNVRLAAFKRLAKFPKFLKIKDRRSLLFTGIFDPTPTIKQFFLTDFLRSWLEQYDEDIITLMKSVRFDADETDIRKTVTLYENILNTFYFKTRSLKQSSEILTLNDEKLIPYEELNWETISYWKLYIIFLSQNEEMESHLTSIIPEFIHFCKYIKGYADYSKDCTSDEFLEKQYIIKQLFLMIKAFDLADPARRQSLYTLVDFILKKVELIDEVVEAIVGALELTMPDPKIRCQFGCEIISDLLYPIDAAEELKKAQEKEFTLSKLKVELNCLQENQEKAVAATDYVEAERLKHEIENVSSQVNNLKNNIYVKPTEDVKKTTDLAVILKCLDIAWAVLRTAKVSALTPSLKGLKNDFIPEMLVHENEIVRMKAMQCYAICCIYDKVTARNGIHIFAVPIAVYQAGEECDIQTLKMCISAVSDLIRIYGADLMAEPSEDQLSDSVNEEHQKVFTGGTSLTALIQGLVDLMDDEQYEVQLTATTGLCKLVLDGRIHAPALISRLVLKWCHPVETDEPENESLKQFIGCLLEKIPHLPNSADQLEGAVLLTVDTLAKAPKNSPLVNVDIDNIAKFMLALCKVSQKGPQIHSNIALSICIKINQHPDENHINIIYSKILLMVDIQEDTMKKKELYELCDVARENITDKRILKNMTKFMANLTTRPEDNENISETVEEPQQEIN